jgi:hypothetical protein
MNWPFARKPVLNQSSLDLSQMDTALSWEVSRLLAASGVPTVRQAFPRLVKELDRARRYARPLAIMIVADHRGAGPTHQSSTEPVVDGASSPARVVPTVSPGSVLIPVFIASVLREVMREADIIAYAAALGRCVVMMPEVSRAEAIRARSRVGELCASRLDFAVRAGIAVFPEDGWTLDDLISNAEHSADRHAAARQEMETLSSEERAAV